MVLTKNQKALLSELLSEPIGVTMECHPHEWRTACSLEKRGLIDIIGGQSEFGSFEIKARQAQAETESGK